MFSRQGEMTSMHTYQEPSLLLGIIKLKIKELNSLGKQSLYICTLTIHGGMLLDALSL